MNRLTENNVSLRRGIAVLVLALADVLYSLPAVLDLSTSLGPRGIHGLLDGVPCIPLAQTKACNALQLTDRVEVGRLTSQHCILPGNAVHLPSL